MTTIESRPPSPEDLADNDQKPCGYGRMMRKEDLRFIRGRGRYVDDIALPGSCIWRSCARRTRTPPSSASM